MRSVLWQGTRARAGRGNQPRLHERRGFPPAGARFHGCPLMVLLRRNTPLLAVRLRPGTCCCGGCCDCCCGCCSAPWHRGQDCLPLISVVSMWCLHVLQRRVVLPSRMALPDATHTWSSGSSTGTAQLGVQGNPGTQQAHVGMLRAGPAPQGQGLAGGAAGRRCAGRCSLRANRADARATTQPDIYLWPLVPPSRHTDAAANGARAQATASGRTVKHAMPPNSHETDAQCARPHLVPAARRIHRTRPLATLLPLHDALGVHRWVGSEQHDRQVGKRLPLLWWQAGH